MFARYFVELQLPFERVRDALTRSPEEWLPGIARSDKACAKAPCASMYHVFGTWINWPTCSRTASTTRGGQWPIRLHPHPGKKSR